MQEPRMGQYAAYGVFLLASLAWAFSGPRLTAEKNAPFSFPQTTARATRKENRPASLDVKLTREGGGKEE